LDLSMPGMGGLAALDALVARRPQVAVIVLSTFSVEGARQTVEALHRGALDFVDKREYSMVDFRVLREVLLEKIRALTEGGPDERDGPARKRPAAGPRVRRAPPPEPEPDGGAADASLLVVGASTGGPPAVQRLLQDLGSRPGLPVCVVQHMPPAFTAAFAERLDAALPVAVRQARDGEALSPSTVYVAPGGRHLLIEARGEALVARLALDPPLPHRPSVDLLFRSAARAVGRRCCAVLLTGMGEDGARGLAAVSEAGGWTAVQDEASSVVFGMPRAALELGAAREILGLEALGARIRELLRPAAPAPPNRP
ncbi:MAG: chemotaxis protein CheB, partial [Thermoanaerobaculia bacterium]